MISTQQFNSQEIVIGSKIPADTLESIEVKTFERNYDGTDLTGAMALNPQFEELVIVPAAWSAYAGQPFAQHWLKHVSLATQKNALMIDFPGVGLMADGSVPKVSVADAEKLAKDNFSSIANNVWKFLNDNGYEESATSVYGQSLGAVVASAIVNYDQHNRIHDVNLVEYPLFRVGNNYRPINTAIFAINAVLNGRNIAEYREQNQFTSTNSDTFADILLMAEQRRMLRLSLSSLANGLPIRQLELLTTKNLRTLAMACGGRSTVSHQPTMLKALELSRSSTRINTVIVDGTHAMLESMPLVSFLAAQGFEKQN